jgi:hypothetical protein
MVDVVTRILLGCAIVLIGALVACTNELTVPTEPLRLLRPEWNVAYVGEPFEGALRPAGGLRPYRFELAEGALPPGMTLSAGRLVGTPTELGRFAFTAMVQDGNLSQAVQRLELEVRPLPTPVIRVDTPATEIRAAVPLVVRVEDARAWSGARLALTWDPELFELSAEPSPGDARLVVFHEAAEGRLSIEAAALGTPRQGAFPLARFSLRPVADPARLSLEVAATSRFAGGDHSAVRLEGAPRPRPGAALPAGTPPTDEPAPSGQDAPEEDDPDDDPGGFDDEDDIEEEEEAP